MVISALVAAGCLSRPHGSGAAGDGAMPDAAAPCLQWSPFSMPVALPGPVQSVDDDWTPTPTKGELVLFFYSYRPGGNPPSIWYATRTTPTDTFGSPMLVSELDGPNGEKEPTLTDDGLVLVYQIGTDQASDLYTASRMSGLTFSSPSPVVELNSPFGDGDPWISADGTRLLFVSTRLDGGAHQLDIFETTRMNRNTSFDAPVALTVLNSDQNEESPTLSADGLDVFFASQRSGGPGGRDVYTAHRTSVTASFDSPHLVNELSSPLDDFGLRLSLDGATMYMNYNAVGSGGSDSALCSAVRTCLQK